MPNTMDEPYYCDPIYEDCYDYTNQFVYEYDKSALHVMVWSALWQWSFPMIAYNINETKAYLDYYKVDEKPAEGATNTDHFTMNVEAWEEIMFVNTALWGPMFSFGILSLSGLLDPVTSLYIEHIISNF